MKYITCILSWMEHQSQTSLFLITTSFMINIEIYRARIGCYTPHKCKKTRNNGNHNIGLLESMLEVSAGDVFCWFSFCFIYTYIICLLMGLMIEITSTVPLFPTSQPAIKSNSIRELLNICIFYYHTYTAKICRV